MKKLTDFEASKCAGGDYICYPFCACSDGETNIDLRLGFFKSLENKGFDTDELEYMQKMCESSIMRSATPRFKNMANVTCKVILDDISLRFCDEKPKMGDLWSKIFN